MDPLSKEERSAQHKAWRDQRDSDKEARDRFLKKSSAYSLKRRYGITTHQLVELAAYQREVCAICGSPPDVSKKRGGLHVDHDHDSGDVRGLLCESCNLGLGFFKDDVVRMQKAIAYLQSPPAEFVQFSKPLCRPEASPKSLPRSTEVLTLTCKQCGSSFQRAAQSEYHSRSKGKEGPFCTRRCSGVWSQAQQKVTGLVHGTTNGYTYYKCRCLECRKAHRDAERFRVRQHKRTRR